jgi:hypothetical protein
VNGCSLLGGAFPALDRGHADHFCLRRFQSQERRRSI